MTHVLNIHEVADYDAWKLVFDGAAGIRRESGERSYQVLRFEKESRKYCPFLCVDVDRSREGIF